ncbi:MAG: DNA gyrase inhibitor YacG [Nitrospirae bacterium]|nr:DNA gyrase inhibitor YacG [Nitrospirota bacterium]
MRITCPTCRQATTWEENKHRPFCSERCRLIDLGQWATEGYAIPGDPAPENSEHFEDAGRSPEAPGT